jgi:beta-phosphoglucomutase-like phosphatase (HAD superfamily)
MPEPVRAVVFDFNGTLSHDEPVLCSIYQELFATRGRPLHEREYYEQLAGLSEEAIISGWLGVEGDELAALVTERVERYRRVVGDGSTVPDEIRAAVRYAAERVPVALVSGAFRAEVEPVLDASGLAPLLEHLVTAEDVVNGKPDPEGYERALSLLELPSEDVVAFEDTEAGVAAAKGAGIRCVAVSGTLPRERLALADELVEAIDVPLLRRLLA